MPNQADTNVLLNLPLRELLNLPFFSNCKVLAGAKGLDRIVTGVNLMDAPDITNWIKPGELLITTCFAIKDNPEALESLIPTLSQTSLSGICIKPKRYLDEIPPIMISTAEDLGFPLIELPPSIYFDDIIDNVFKLLLSQQTDFLQQVLEFNELLMKMTLEGVNLYKFAETIATLVDNSVLIVDIINNREAFYHAPDAKISLEPGQNYIWKELSGQANDHAVNHMIKPLTIGNKKYGSICVWETKRPFRKLDTDIINRLALAVTLEISRESTLREIEYNYFNDFLIHLLNDQLNDEQKETARAQKFGMDLSKPHLAAHLHITVKNGESPSYNAPILSNAIFRDIEMMLKKRGLPCYLVRESPLYTMIIAANEQGKIADNIKEQLAQAIRGIKDNYKEIQITLGCGRVYSGMHGLRQSNQEAKTTLNINETLHLNNGILTFDELGLYRFIYAKNPDIEVNNFIKENIGNLIEYDHLKKSDLLNTLDKYFEYNGNLKKMAEKMFTHYNTIIYRLERIKEISNLDLNIEEDRFKLEIALKLFKLNTTMKIPQKA